MLAKGANILLLVLGVVTLILSLVSVDTNLQNDLAKYNDDPDHTVAEKNALEVRAPDGATLQANAVILVVVSVLLVLLESNGAFNLNIKSEPIIIVVPLFLVIFGILSLISGTNAQLPRDQRGTIQILKRLKALKDKNASDKADRRIIREKKQKKKNIKS
jgi:hypothetical protein